MSQASISELAELMRRAQALEARVHRLQRTIDDLREQAQSCIAVRQRQIELLAAACVD